MNKPIDAAVRSVMKLSPLERRQAVNAIIIGMDAEGDGTPHDELDKQWATELERRMTDALRAPHGTSIEATFRIIDRELVRRRKACNQASREKPVRRRAR